MKTGSIFAAIGFAVAVASGAQAAEIRVLSSNAAKTALEELAPRFEKATEHKLAFTFGTAVGLKSDIEDAARTLIKFLTSPDAAPVFKAKGLEPAS